MWKGGGGLGVVSRAAVARAGCLDVHKLHTLRGLQEGDAGVSGVEWCWLEPSCEFFTFRPFGIMCA